MQSFKITLPNNKLLTGLHSFPSPIAPNTPLIVALHGGTYTAKYFDVDTAHTASLASIGLGVPFVAIDRPGYAGSTSFFPIPSDSSYPQELGSWLHQYILPALWKEFGEPSGCSCIVLHSHSLGATGAIIAAGLHAEEANKAYPLAGISMSGFGSQPTGPPPKPPQDPDAPPATTITIPPVFKDAVMLQKGLANPEIYKYTEALNQSMPVEEAADIERAWFPKWKEWAASVEVPVMIGLAGSDLMWKGTEDHLREFSLAFTKSARVDGTVVLGAPHNMEMSHWARGWYARCFGFALECAACFERE